MQPARETRHVKPSTAGITEEDEEEREEVMLDELIHMTHTIYAYSYIRQKRM